MESDLTDVHSRQPPHHSLQLVDIHDTALSTTREYGYHLAGRELVFQHRADPGRHDNVGTGDRIVIDGRFVFEIEGFHKVLMARCVF